MGVSEGNRFFIGLAIPEAVKQELRTQQECLQRISPEIFKMTELSNLHLTLYFCGNTDEETMVRIGNGLGEMDLMQLELQIDGLKRLPSNDVPKILSAGVSSRGRELAAMQQRVHDLCFALAENKEMRPFAPHITFARLAHGVPPSAKPVKRAIAGLPDLSATRWNVDEIGIYSSELTKQGPNYEVVRTIPLS